MAGAAGALLRHPISRIAIAAIPRAQARVIFILLLNFHAPTSRPQQLDTLIRCGRWANCRMFKHALRLGGADGATV
jgi:hypothetical protein